MKGQSAHAYDAFISYSHAADGRMAPALQGALHRFAKPWYRTRALRVFRDATNLEVSPGLWDSIVAALGSSERFLLLASPQAAASKWVQREVDYWLSQRDPTHLLILLTDGELLWSESAGDFDWQRSNVLPPALVGRFAQEPLFLDLRWARKEEDLSLRNPRFLDAVAQIAAPMHGRSKDDLVGEDVVQHRRTQRWVRGGIASLATLTAVSTVAAIVAVEQRRVADEQTALAGHEKRQAEEQRQLADEQRQLAEQQRQRADDQRDLAEQQRQRADDQRDLAEEQRQLAVDRLRQAESRRLAAQAVRLLNQDDALLIRAGLLAVESLRLTMNDEAAEALRAVLARAAMPLAAHSLGTDPSNASDSTMEVIWSSDDQRRNGHDDWAVQVRWGGDAPIDLKPGVGSEGPPDCGPNQPGWMTVEVAPGQRALRVSDARSGQVLRLVHDGPITGCAVSLDGQRVFTISTSISVSLGDEVPGDGSVRVWDVRPHLQGLGQLRSDDHRLQVSAFSPDGRLAAAADYNGDRVRLFEMTTGVQVATLPVDPGVTVVELRFSPDSQRLAALPIYTDHVYVWSVAHSTEPQLLHRLPQPTSEGGLAFSADSRFLAVDFGGLSAGEDATYWDLDTGKPLSALQSGRRNGSASKVSQVVFAPDGRRLLKARRDGALETWDVEQQRKTGGAKPSEESAALINADVTRFASVDRYRGVTVWSVDPIRELMVLGQPSLIVNPIAFSPKGRFLVTSDDKFDEESGRESSTVNVWALADRRLRQSYTYGESIGGVGFTPDGRWLAVSTYAYGGRQMTGLRVSNVMDVYDTTTWARTARLGHQGLVAEAEFSPDGRYLAANVHLSEESGSAPAFVWLWRREDLIAAGCARMTRWSLTPEEWAEYLPGQTERATCGQ